MDLKQNQVLIGELIVNPRAKTILARNFPQLMNPFLLNVARRMTLENTLKLAAGPYAQDQITKIVSALNAI